MSLFWTTHLFLGSVWTTCWCSASCDWLPSGTVPSCGPEIHRSAHPESETAAIKQTHQIRLNQRTRNGAVYKGENAIDWKRDRPAASLQSQMRVHLMCRRLCWVCRGRGRPRWRLETHTDTWPWDISSLGLWLPESSLWSKSTMRRRDQHINQQTFLSGVKKKSKNKENSLPCGQQT